MQRSFALTLASCLFCCAVATAGACKDATTSTSGGPPPLVLELLAFDTALAPRGKRPFIVGETVHLALSIRGGRAPYELQVVTKRGDPRLASSAATIEAGPQGETTAGLELTLGSDVVSGSYALTVRISDQDGESSHLQTENFEVLGSDAPMQPTAIAPLHLRVVDIAGQARRTFYQGEAIAIRATLAVPQDLAIAIVASDERPFMPKQHYPAAGVNIDLPLQVPRLARIGDYRVDIATADDEASVPIRIEGTAYPAAQTPVLTDLHIYGGPEQRIPRKGLITRGETVRIEAVLGGIRILATPRLRLRSRVGKEVAKHDFPAVAPADPDPAARSLLSVLWTPPADLQRGRHVLELELEEGDKISTLYREIVLQ